MEILVAVDTTENRTIDVVREHAKKHRNIHLNFSQERRDITKALGCLIKQAKGEIILKVDSEYRYQETISKNSFYIGCYSSVAMDQAQKVITKIIDFFKSLIKRLLKMLSNIKYYI